MNFLHFHQKKGGWRAVCFFIALLGVMPFAAFAQPVSSCCGPDYVAPKPGPTKSIPTEKGQTSTPTGQESMLPVCANNAFWAIPDTNVAINANSVACFGLPLSAFQVLTGFTGTTKTAFARVGIVQGWPGGSSAEATLTVRLYSLTNPAMPYNVSSGNRVLIGSSSAFSVPPGSQGTMVNVPIDVTIPAGTTVLMEVASSHSFVISMPPGAGTKTWWASDACGFLTANPLLMVSLGIGGFDMKAILYGCSIQAVCQNVTVPLGQNENYTLVTPAQVDGGSSGNGQLTMTVSPNQFTCSNIGPNTVTLTVVDAAGQSSSCQATVTVEPPASLFSVADKSVIEGSPSGTTSMLFQVVRSSAKCAASVQYSTANATALAPEDYAQAVGTLNFWPNQSSQNVTVSIKKDSKVELLETFSFNLMNPVGGTFGDNQAIGTIQNDDDAAIQIQNVSTSEGNIGLKNSTFTATILKAADVPISFDFSTSDGSATVADNDYLPLAATTVTIPAGLLSQTFSIQLKGDTKFEPNETVNLNFSNVQASGRSVTLAQTARTATILNDDAASMAGKNDGSKSEKVEVEAAERGAEKFSIQHSAFSIFPNPTTDGFLNVILEKGDWQITVFDVAGKMLFTQKASVAEGDIFQIDAQKMPVGVHFLKAENLAAPEKSGVRRWTKIN